MLDQFLLSALAVASKLHSSEHECSLTYMSGMSSQRYQHQYFGPYECSLTYTNWEYYNACCILLLLMQIMKDLQCTGYYPVS